MKTSYTLLVIISSALIALAACDTEQADDTPAASSSGSGGEGVGGSGSGGITSCDSGTLCDNSCVDLDSDPNNCGTCGRTCVVPGADAACDAGECALGSCQAGYADCDDDIANGCEAATSCDPGGACTTTCDSQGTLSCADVCSPGLCEAPVESCNLIDDDCDGSCDEDVMGGCRIGVHRSSGSIGHYYTTDESDAVNKGNTIEALNYFYLYKEPGGALRPLFRCLKSNGKTLLTTATHCDMLGSVQATVGFIAPAADCGANTPLYQLHHAPSNNHFYTTSAAERDNAVNNLGYSFQREVGYVWGGP